MKNIIEELRNGERGPQGALENALHMIAAEGHG